MELYHDENITLYNADCMNVLSSIKTESIDLIVTDPPYLCKPKGRSNKMGGFWKYSTDGKIFENNNLPCEKYLPELYRVLKDGTHCYIMVNNYNLIKMLNGAEKAGFKFIKSIIWNKNHKICSRFYMHSYEYILMFRKGKGRNINNFSTPDILDVPMSKTKDDNGENLHNTEKPVELMKILIENSSNENELVLDPFAGIGSTLIASTLLKRKSIGIEIDAGYCEKIIKRLEKMKNEIAA